MRILATFKAKYQENGHLSIPEDVASSLSLEKRGSGEERSSFDLLP
jgi:hypothetical protein